MGLWVLLLCGLAASLSIDSTLKMVVDEFHRARLFHGVNVVYKLPPYIPDISAFDPETSLTDEDISYMKSWGFNLVRLGVLWEAVEVEVGVYNTTYLAELNALVNRLGAAGIYTMIDSHQDLFTRALCGEGMPSFLVNNLSHSCDSHLLSGLFWLIGMCRSEESYDMQTDSNGNPLIEDCIQHSFYKMYLSPETNSLFEQFYNNVEGLQDRFLAYWQVVHDTFGSNPYVYGYDLLNEPWPGNFYATPTLLLPGRLDLEFLQPLYTRVADMMRNTTANATMLFEPVQFGDVMSLFGGITFHTGFTTPPGSTNQQNALLNDHIYCCEMSYDACESGEPTLENALNACATFNREKALTRKEDADKLGVGFLISEFGACFDTLACAAEVTAITSAADEVLASWAYWQYKGYNDFTTFTAALGTGEGLFYPNSTVQNTKVKALTRTYAYATQGVPVSMYFNPETSAFAFSYNVNTSIEAPTEIYYNTEYYYPGPTRLTVLCGNFSSCSPTLSFATPQVATIFVPKTSHIPDGTSISLLLTPDVSNTVGSFTSDFCNVAYNVVDSSAAYPGQVVINVNLQYFTQGNYQVQLISQQYGELCELTFSPPFPDIASQNCTVNTILLAYEYQLLFVSKHFLCEDTVDITVASLNDNTLNILISP